MTLLIIGMIVFIGVHALTTQRARRATLIARLGENGYKGLYSVASLVGLVLMIYGYGAARLVGYAPVYSPQPWMGHLVSLLMLVSFIALAAAYAPLGRIKAALKHPMMVSVKAWALAHLIVNPDLPGLVLFGGLLAWVVFARISIKSRPDAIEPPASGWTTGDGIAIGGGLAATLAMILWLHPLLIGVPAIIR